LEGDFPKEAKGEEAARVQVATESDTATWEVPLAQILEEVEHMSTHPKLLTDTLPVTLQLVEGSEGSNGKIIVRGEFAKIGIPTANRRVYTEALWKKQIGRLGKPMTERRVFGEIDHPSDGKLSLQRVSHLVTKLEMKDGLIIGEAEVLPTDLGKNLAVLLKSGCQVGVSSRGFGSTRTDDSGNEEVQEDYKLVTFDFVAEPADVDAYPEIVSEGKQVIFEGMQIECEDCDKCDSCDKSEADAVQEAAEATEESEEVVEGLTPDSVTDDELAKAELFAKMVSEMDGDGPESETAKEQLRDEFSAFVVEHVNNMRSEVRDEVRAELLNDPSVAASKETLDSLLVLLRPHLLPEDVAQELTVLQAENMQLKERTTKLEEAMSSMDKAVLSKDALLAEAQAAIEMAQGSLVEDRSGEVTALQEQVAEARTAFEEEVKEHEVAVQRLEKLANHISNMEGVFEDLQEALVVSKMDTYAANRLVHHPEAGKIRKGLEGRQFVSEDQVDEFFDQFREPTRDSEDLAQIRARIREQVRGGREYGEMSEARDHTRKKQEAPDDFLGLGASIGVLKQLSGIPSVE